MNRFRGAKHSQALKFVLIDRNTEFWHKFNKGDFVVPLAGAASAPAPPPPVQEAPVELLQVWAFLRWDEAGRPEVTEAEKYALAFVLLPSSPSSSFPVLSSPTVSSPAAKVSRPRRIFLHSQRRRIAKAPD